MAEYPIKHWSHSSLTSFLRNPLAWYKRYVEHIYDTPSTPAGIIGRAGHVALQHYYGGMDKEAAIDIGLHYLRDVPDFEIEFGKNKTKTSQKKKRLSMERDYLQAVGFYLARAPRHDVIGIEVSAMATVDGIPIPIKAISDLVVESKVERGALDIVDHKFVDFFTNPNLGADKPLFVLQALFNYYTVLQKYNRPVRRFIIVECKKRKNKDGKSQLRKHTIDFKECEDDFRVFRKLLKDATEEIGRTRVFLPNPSDMFEGKNSFEIYRLGLAED